MRFPSFTRAAGPGTGDRVELTYETPSEEVLDLPPGALLFEGEPEPAAERREFDLRTLGPTEFDR
jgi:hypothetical protein